MNCVKEMVVSAYPISVIVVHAIVKGKEREYDSFSPP